MTSPSDDTPHPTVLGRLELFAEAPVPYVALNSRGLVEDFNRGALDFLGRTALELSGSVFSSLLEPDQRAAFSGLLHRFFGEGGSLSFDARFPLPGHPSRRAVVFGSPLSDSGGRPLLCLTLGKSPAGGRDEEDERPRLIEELKHKNVELEQFTYSVSHDLKSPLHTIKGFVDVMQHDVDNGRYGSLAKDLVRVREAADRMQELLDAILALSRAGRVIGPKDDVALGPLFGEVLRLLDAQISRRGVAVSVAPDLPAVRGDRVRLREVVQNLVENAVKFLGWQENPCVSISAVRLGAEVRVSIRDNGIGLSERDCQAIFELFRKVDPRAEGAGIGLALAKRIVEVHGGRIWAESDGPGRGTTFVFALPVDGEPILS
ncbi:phytochrome-like protein cph1 [mine drainage metagenome]|uniref:histidine kinase n=1 Tax=mine drainage metagenome TaxID=410659 RepID=A0A1J5S3S2_9ZZZZ